MTATATLSLRDLENFDGRAAAVVPGQGERRFLCPLCGDGKPRDGAHRSLCANTGTGVWKCHRCGAGGKLREWWTEAVETVLPRRDRMRVALRRSFDLPHTSNPSPPVAPPRSDDRGNWRGALRVVTPLCGTDGERYLAGRGIPVEVAHEAGVRFSSDWFGRAAVLFPIRDAGGALVAAQGRYLDDAGSLKTRTAGRKKLGVFATRGALNTETLVVTEAPIDAVSLAACGVPAIAICGKDGWPAWLPVRCGLRRVMAAFDSDAAGDDAATKLTAAVSYLGARVERLRPEGAKDWNELLVRHGTERLEAALREAWPPPEMEVASSSPVNAYAALREAARRAGVPPGPAVLPDGTTIADPARWILECGDVLSAEERRVLDALEDWWQETLWE